MVTRDSYRTLLKVPGLSSLLLAMTLSRLAARMFVLTLVLFALARFASPVLAGWLTFAVTAPGMLVSPLTGALLDGIGPTRALKVDLFASAFCVAAISLVGRVGAAIPAVLFTLVILFSLSGPLGAAGTRVLVPPEALDRANALDTAAYAIVDVVGPAFAGLIVAWRGPELAMSMIACAYAGAVILLLKVPHLPGYGSRQTSLFDQTIEGIRIVMRQPTLRGLAICCSLYNVTWGALVVLVPVFVTDRLMMADGGSVTGLLWAAMGVTGGMGALLAGHLRTTGQERHVIAIGMIVTALAAWPVAAEFGLGGLAIGLMLAGAVDGPINVALLTLRQRRTDPRQLGRVLSISMSLNLVGFPLGSAIAGMMISTSLSATFAMAGLASAMGAIATISIPRDVKPAM